METNPSDAKTIVRNDIKVFREFILTNNLFGEIELPNRPVQIGIVNKGGQGERIYDPRGHAITLSAHGGGVGAKTGLYKVGEIIRKLSPRECARILGFPESFKISKSISQAYKQFGNSVAVNVLVHLLLQIEKTEVNEVIGEEKCQKVA